MMDDMEFDLGPLTWVKGEIDSALASARQELTSWNGEDTNPLKAAAAHLHQVSGALTIVDLQGVSLLCAETERLLGDMATQDALRTADSAAVATRAIEALIAYLDDLMGGAANTELRLSGPYAEVVAQRGMEPPAPSELFFPDVSARVSRQGEPAPALDDAAFNQAVRRARGIYQKGLLFFLQDKDTQGGLGFMQEAAAELARISPSSAQHTFWWAVNGLLLSLRQGTVPVDTWTKRLCSRIDVQIRRLAEGSRQLAERLLRDVLYHLVQDTRGEQARAVRELFQLDRYLPEPAAAGDEDWRPHLHTLREALNAAKDQWMKFCSGRTDSQGPFQNAALAMFEAAIRLPNAKLHELLRMMQAVAKRLPDLPDSAHNDALQLEMATALLLTDNATDHFDALGDEFDRQADVQTQRLQAAIEPGYDASAIPAVALLDEVSRKAQEKLLLAHVTKEIQSNLNEVEGILDKFFRNAEERSQLPLVPALMKQILGALNILQLDMAADLTRQALQRITDFADPEHAISSDELNWVADALSSLGLYVESLRYGRDDRQQLASLLAQPVAPPSAEAGIEAEVRDELSDLQSLAASLDSPESLAEKHAMLRAALVKLGRDADLIGDAMLREQAGHATRLLDGQGDLAAIQSAIRQLGQQAAQEQPAPVTATELAQASSEAIDAEMLNVYIEEANEVLGQIATQLARLHVTLYDQDAFGTVRRGFHTLKGSGRMVGLTDLAEVAWQVEDTLNGWLREERAPTPELVDFLERVTDAFTGWIHALEATGHAEVTAADLVGEARRLRGEGAPPIEQAVPEETVETMETLEPAPGAAASEPEETVLIGGLSLPAALYQIFLDESALRLQELENGLAGIAGSPTAERWETFARTAHTLAGIARTTGFTPLAEAAHALERWAGARLERTPTLDETAVHGLRDILQEIASQKSAIAAGLWPAEITSLASRLDELSPEGVPVPSISIEEALVAELTAEAPAQLPEPSPEAAPAFETMIEAFSAAETVPPPEPAQMAEAEAAPSPAPVTEAASVQPAATPEPPREFASAPAPAAVKPAAEEEAAPETLIHDELDLQLLPIFLEEAAELLPQIGVNLRRWRGDQHDTSARQALQRALHTLKGSARMAGAMRLGERTHSLEARLIEQGEAAPPTEFLDALEAEYDELSDMVERLKGGELAGQAGETAGAMPAPAAVPASVDDDLRLRQTLKLKTNILDNLLNEAGEVAITRARIQTVLTGYKQTAMELSVNVERLRTQLRELEIQAESQMRSRQSLVDESQFDPLEFDRYTRLQELTRMLAESVNDVSTAQDNLLSGLDDADRALHLQSYMTRNLQQELMRMRMVPFNTLAERMHRVVRQAAKELGRKAQLELEGGRTELDRSVLDRIAAPLEHLLRNAVAHGVETPEVRQAAGKPEYGEIQLAVHQEGNEIVIVASDDGAGVNLDAVRARAESLGWLMHGEEASVERLEGFLFMPGFSTAREVTEIAGRGIGLDVVKNEMASVGGRIRLESEPGLGTRFIIRLPLTLAVAPVVLARAGGQVFALPANQVASVQEVPLDDLPRLHAEGTLEFEGERYPLRTLAEITDRQPEPGEGRHRTILYMRGSARERLALRVDAMEGNYEAVVKNIGPQIARIPGITGATVLGDGRVALILNPFVMAERAHGTANVVEEIRAEEALPPLVLVVDDSLTVRKITTRMLERAGYRVATAHDGVEALEYLQQERPDAILMDIEMPRMDGFEATRSIRADAALQALPIIIITSRTAEKHRQHAMELGVNAYLGKPYQEEELLAELKRFAPMAETV